MPSSCHAPCIETAAVQGCEARHRTIFGREQARGLPREEAFGLDGAPVVGVQAELVDLLVAQQRRVDLVLCPHIPHAEAARWQLPAHQHITFPNIARQSIERRALVKYANDWADFSMRRKGRRRPDLDTLATNS
eukprot:2197379-Rhodomonas_salina.3